MPRIDTRMYSNLVLTVIALVLVAGAARDAGVSFLGTAQAQKNTAQNLERTATGFTIDNTIPQTQDVAVAAATSEVAASNREIAEALHEVAVAIREGMGDVRNSLKAAPAAGTAAPGTAATPVKPASDARPVIEVTR